MAAPPLAALTALESAQADPTASQNPACQKHLCAATGKDDRIDVGLFRHSDCGDCAHDE